MCVYCIYLDIYMNMYIWILKNICAYMYYVSIDKSKIYLFVRVCVYIFKLYPVLFIQFARVIVNSVLLA